MQILNIIIVAATKSEYFLTETKIINLRTGPNVVKKF